MYLQAFRWKTEPGENVAYFGDNNEIPLDWSHENNPFTNSITFAESKNGEPDLAKAQEKNLREHLWEETEKKRRK